VRRRRRGRHQPSRSFGSRSRLSEHGGSFSHVVPGVGPADAGNSPPCSRTSRATPEPPRHGPIRPPTAPSRRSAPPRRPPHSPRSGPCPAPFGTAGTRESGNGEVRPPSSLLRARTRSPRPAKGDNRVIEVHLRDRNLRRWFGSEIGPEDSVAATCVPSADADSSSVISRLRTSEKPRAPLPVTLFSFDGSLKFFRKIHFRRHDEKIGGGVRFSPADSTLPGAFDAVQPRCSRAELPQLNSGEVEISSHRRRQVVPIDPAPEALSRWDNPPILRANFAVGRVLPSPVEKSTENPLSSRTC